PSFLVRCCCSCPFPSLPVACHFFFQAEGGIRDRNVTGVQTCALPVAGLGALIGTGELSVWHAWLAGSVGSLLGDWISFWLGWRFKKPLHRWSFLKKNKALLDKTEHALHQHSMFTILVGRFVGPTRPLVPMVAGMLDLPVAKFITPNIIGCLLWPPFYFLPGILAGAAIDIPAGMQSGEFKWLLLAT